MKIQRRRVLKKKDWDEDRLKKTLKNQISDKKKRLLEILS